MRKKNLRKKNRKKFKNFIYQFCYLNTSFSGHLEQNQCCPELPSCASVFTPSTSFIYIIIKQKNISFALIKFYLIQNKIMFQIDKRSYVEGTFFDIPVLNRRAENCPELPGMPLLFMYFGDIVSYGIEHWHIYCKYSMVGNQYHILTTQYFIFYFLICYIITYDAIRREKYVFKDCKNCDTTTLDLITIL